jgi:hypothetical protein
MPELGFIVRSADAARFTAAPRISLELAIATSAPVRAVLLRCQVRIAVSRRAYAASESAQLVELFGDRTRSTPSLLWAELVTNVSEFESETTVELGLPVSHHVDASIAKYLRALDSGLVPIVLLFSGSIFHAPAPGTLSVSPIPWSKEAHFPLPYDLVRQALALHDPDAEPVPLARELIRKLDAFRIERGLAGIDRAIETLLEQHRTQRPEGSGLQ